MDLTDVLKLILVFFTIGKKYADEAAAGGGYHTVYTDDGDGNITITIEGGNS